MSLRDRFHHAIANLTTRHPRLVVVVALLVSVIAARQGIGPLLNIDTDILNQLPRDMPSVRAYREAVQNFGALDHLYCVVRTTDGEPNVPLLIEAAERLAASVENPEFVFEVQWSLDPDTQDHYGEATGITHGLLLPAEQWRAVRDEVFHPERLRQVAVRTRHLLTSPLPPRVVRERLRDPFRLSSTLRRHLLSTRSPVAFDPQSGHFLSGEGDMLLLVIRPLKPPTDLLFSQELMQHVRRSAARVEQEFSHREGAEGHQGGVRIGFLGPHAETLYDTGLFRQDVMSTALASGICVISLFIIAFRRWSAVLFVGIPLVLGIVWTLGLVSLVIHRLTIVTCAFAAIVLGLGIDFGIHLYNRFLEDRLEDHPTRHSVRTALVEVGPGIFTGGITTALAFFALLLTDFPGFQELGAIGGTGILCCLASMYLVMPALLMALHHNRPRSRHQRLTSFGLEALADAVARRPRATLLAGLIVTVWLGALSMSLEFDDDLFHLREVPREQTQLRAYAENRFALPGQPLLLTVSGEPDLQAALTANDALHRNLVEISDLLDIGAIDSLRTLLPSETSQQETRTTVGSLDLESIRGAVSAVGARVGLSGAAFEPGLDRVAAWQRETQEASALRLNLLSRRSLRHLVLNYAYHAGEEYQVMTSVYPEGDRFSAYNQSLMMTLLEGRLREDLELDEGAPAGIEVTGVPLLVDELRSLIKRDLALMVFVVTLSVMGALVIHFHSLRHALLVTVPTLAAVLWTLGLMAMVGMSLNFINVLALPIVIGLGIDNGLHILERHRSSREERIDEAVVKTGRAVVVTSLSTILAFGALSLASFQGIQELGTLALVGVAVSLITAITMIPAILEAMGRRQGWRGLFRPDSG